MLSLTPRYMLDKGCYQLIGPLTLSHANRASKSLKGKIEIILMFDLNGILLRVYGWRGNLFANPLMGMFVSLFLRLFRLSLNYGLQSS